MTGKWNMNRKKLIKLAASSLVLSAVTVGAVGLGSVASASSSAEASAKRAASDMKKAEKALAKGQLDKALGYAERAVEGDPRNVAARTLLARVYTAEGRFAAAERSWQDVIELGAVDARSVLGVVLAQTAQGKVGEAKALLEANREVIPAADFGLALALAGDSSRAVEVLTDAIRRDDANARTRQNLALAYALDGRWREARIMAVQDMPSDQVDARIAEWAQIARPGAYSQRVASLLKVTPREDAGQPYRLALNPAPAPVQQAAIEPVPQPAAPSAIGELPPVGPAVGGGTEFAAAVVEAAPMVAPAVAPALAPVVTAAVSPQIVFVPGTGLFGTPPAYEPTKPAPRVKAQAVALKAPVKAVAGKAAAAKPAFAPARGSSHGIQLGAFDSQGVAQDAWARYARKYGSLRGFAPSYQTVQVNGRSFVRLTATGFGNLAGAQGVCSQIKARGDACFAKPVAGATRVASR